MNYLDTSKFVYSVFQIVLLAHLLCCRVCIITLLLLLHASILLLLLLLLLLLYILVLSLSLLFFEKKKQTKQSILLRFSRCFIHMYCFYRTTHNQQALKQVDPEDGVTVVFHVLLESYFKMEEGRLHIRAGARDLGLFNINCVDLTPVG